MLQVAKSDNLLRSSKFALAAGPALRCRLTTMHLFDQFTKYKKPARREPGGFSNLVAGAGLEPATFGL